MTIASELGVFKMLFILVFLQTGNLLTYHSQRRASNNRVKVTEAVPYLPAGGQRGQLLPPGKLEFVLTLCLSLMSYFL